MGINIQNLKIGDFVAIDHERPAGVFWGRVVSLSPVNDRVAVSIQGFLVEPIGGGIGFWGCRMTVRTENVYKGSRSVKYL